ncbi:MAG: FkbM family methyltransferase [Pseudomonadota bacterium]
MPASRSFKRLRQQFSRRLAAAAVAAGVVLERTAKSSSFDALLERRYRRVRREGQTFNFVQIGANDGVTHDPIRAFVTSHSVQGLVIEPQPDVFAALAANYDAYPAIRPLNLAIHASEAQVTLHRPDPAQTAGHSGIASFNPDRYALTAQRTGLAAEQMTSVEVPARPLMALLEETDLERLDLLQIDAEGYDFEILKSLDLDRCQPAIIRFEHGVYSGSGQRQALKEALMRFFDAGYAVAMERVDAVLWRQEFL